jgi:hypothetical protein
MFINMTRFKTTADGCQHDLEAGLPTSFPSTGSMTEETRSHTWESKEKWRADPFIQILPTSREFIVHFHDCGHGDSIGSELHLRLQCEDTVGDLKDKVRAIKFTYV